MTDAVRIIAREKNRYRLGLDDVEPDILGRMYEYLLRKFAEGSGQSAGYPPSNSADWGWVQHMFASLNDRGRLAVVLDTGSVSRGSGNKGSNRKRGIRRKFVENDWIEEEEILPLDEAIVELKEAEEIIKEAEEKLREILRKLEIERLYQGLEYGKGT